MTDDEYQSFVNLRNSYTDAIVADTSSKKLVVAGPGTGKSTLFQLVAKKHIEGGRGNVIVLSFINELVRDLAISMHGLAKISTLHSFAASQLRSQQEFYMDLLKVLELDYKIETGSEVDFATILHNLELTETDAIDYIHARRRYYKSYEPSTMVFDLVAHYADDSKIPPFDLILVDEYQDFNRLEVELINLLSSKTEVLIAGDDDQSLYSFKHAVPEHIRELADAGEFSVFNLPFSSRSTEVVIRAFHDVIDKAAAEGLIRNRIEKEYKYFPCKEKDELSRLHGTIDVRLGMYQSQNGFYIDSQIKKTFETDPRFDVLVICPLKKQISVIAASLRRLGYMNVESDDNYSDEYSQLSDGLRLLVEDKDSNLGWRLCSEVLLKDDDTALEEAVRKSAARDKGFASCLPSSVRSIVKTLRAASVKLQEDKPLSESQRSMIFSHLGIQPETLGERTAKSMIFSSSYRNVHHGIKIKITTILGSKGLSYDYVYLVNFDDRFLNPHGPTDESVNKFLVALTRSRKKLFIYSQQNSEPQLVSWIDATRKSTKTLNTK
jgi:superfamily I DNA/RNA helicase